MGTVPENIIGLLIIDSKLSVFFPYVNSTLTHGTHLADMLFHVDRP